MKKDRKGKLIQELKKIKGEKRNITFSFDSSLIDEFKKQCDKHDLKMNAVVERLIKDFLSDE